MADPKVLLVEDDAVILMMAADMLTDAGLTVIEVQTAEAAAAILKTRGEEITAVFSDIETPGGMDGIDLARLAKDLHPTLPVVLASGRVTPDAAHLPEGVTFIRKPYDVQQTTTLIVELAQGCRSEEPDA